MYNNLSSKTKAPKTDILKTWLLITAVVVLLSITYGYELQYYRNQDAEASLDAICARADALPMLCEGRGKQ